jgi:hypothetical protein
VSTGRRLLVLTDLYLYDFDGTLFRSPDEPAWWDEEADGWFFNHPSSLGSPCVPEVPDDEWWAVNLVKGAKIALEWPHVLSILCTGRQEEIFGGRVRELLAQQQLDFAEVNCNPNTSTKLWKAGVALRHLRANPTIKKITILDDDTEKMEYYIETLSPFVEVTPFPVVISRPLDMVTRLMDRVLGTPTPPEVERLG